MKEKKIKIISGISAFLLSVTLVLSLVLPTLYVFALSPGSILETLRKTNYYHGVQENLLENANDFLIPTGLPEKVLDGVFPLVDVEEMVKEQIQGSNSVQSVRFIETQNETRIKENIEAYLKEIGVSQDEVSEEQLDEIAKALINSFQNYTAFPFAAQLLRIRDLYARLMWIVLSMCIFLGIGTLSLIYKINEWRHILLRYACYSMGGAVLMLVLPTLVVRTMGVYERIHISPQYVYDFLVWHVQKGLNSLIICGSVALVCAIALGVLSERMRKRLISRSRKRNNIAMPIGGHFLQR